MKGLLIGTLLLAASCHAGAPATAPDSPPGDISMKDPGMMGSGPMGGGMGGMMGSSGMGAMRDLMSWMNGADLDGAPTEPRPVEDDGLRALGARLYGGRCAVCHGEKGDGRGKEAARLSVPPRDFTTGTYKLRSTLTGALPTDEDLFRTLSRGVHGTAMVPWTALSERERWSLAAYLKTFSRRFAEEPPPSPVSVPTAPAETAELAARGRSVYLRVECSECHGASGHGDGPSAATLRDDAGWPIRPRDLARGRLRRGSRMVDIYLTLHTGMDGSPMPSFDGALTPGETWALAAYVRSLLPRASPGRGMMGPMMGSGADPEERLGMIIDMPGMPGEMGMPMGPGRP